jgi:hypothetical protein
VPFHVEIRRGFRIARALNVTEAELQARVLEPWRRGAEVALGDRTWKAGDATLRVLEGPELDAAQLAMGQGWTNAERSARDVTRRLLAEDAGAPAPPVAVLAQSEAGRAAAHAVLAHAGLVPLAWEPVRTALLAAARGETPAAPLALSGALLAFDGEARSEASTVAEAWWLDVGLALGAFGWRAVPASFHGAVLPAPLGSAAGAALPLDDPASAALALPERLRVADRGPR